jgi:LPXTG-site transpeptidase (sortase) family protein
MRNAPKRLRIPVRGAGGIDGGIRRCRRIPPFHEIVRHGRILAVRRFRTGRRALQKRLDRRILYRLSNAGFLAAALLLALPYGMSVYGHWSQAQAVERFDAEQPKELPVPRPMSDFPADPPARAEKSELPSVSVREVRRKKGKAKSPVVRKRPLRFSPPEDAAPASEGATEIRIPSIGVKAIVAEGIGDWKWMTGPAHEPESAGPGEFGNCIIGAHRNMWDATFADLPRVKAGDRIELRTAGGRYEYAVRSSRAVSTRDKKPLQESAEGKLTLYTCVLPFRENRRWVVEARLVEPDL